ncbi:MAG: VOC family protein [Myxococcota bacterium]
MTLLRTSSLVCLGLLALACGPKQPPTPPAPPPEPVEEPEPVDPIPAEFGALTPHLLVNDVAAAAEFYGNALGAETVYTLPAPDGSTVMHAELKVGDSTLMLAPASEEAKDPMMLGGSPVRMMLYVENADAAFEAAIAAGAIAEMPVADQFWGDRYGAFIDPFGHSWAVSTHVEDLTPEQMQQRAEIANSKKKRRRKKKGKPAWAAVEGTPATQKVPEDYHTITMSLTVNGASDAIDFYTNAFGATERARMPMPDGRLMHAEVQIGDAVLMLADEFPEMGAVSAQTLGGSPVTLHHYVQDADATHAKAVESGASQVTAVEQQFWGDRYGSLTDPAGIPWGVATQVENVTPEQMLERIQAMGQPAEGGAETPAEGEAEAPAEASAP